MPATEFVVERICYTGENDTNRTQEIHSRHYASYRDAARAAAGLTEHVKQFDVHGERYSFFVATELNAPVARPVWGIMYHDADGTSQLCEGYDREVFTAYRTEAEAVASATEFQIDAAPGCRYVAVALPHGFSVCLAGVDGMTLSVDHVETDSTSVYQFVGLSEDALEMTWTDAIESIAAAKASAEYALFAGMMRDHGFADACTQRMRLSTHNARAARLYRGDDWRAEWAECAIGETTHGYPVIVESDAFGNGSLIIAALPPPALERFVVWFQDHEGNTYEGDYMRSMTEALQTFRRRHY